MAMLTLEEAARLSGKSKSTLARAIKAGRLSANRTDLGTYEIDQAELDGKGQDDYDRFLFSERNMSPITRPTTTIAATKTIRKVVVSRAIRRPFSLPVLCAHSSYSPSARKLKNSNWDTTPRRRGDRITPQCPLLTQSGHP
jgi:excisionase family DNA binding protein